MTGRSKHFCCLELDSLLLYEITVGVYIFFLPLVAFVRYKILKSVAALYRDKRPFVLLSIQYRYSPQNS